MYVGAGKDSLLTHVRRALATNFTFKSAYLARSHYLSAIKNLKGRRRSATPTYPLLSHYCLLRSTFRSSAFSHFCIHRAGTGEKKILTVRVVSHRPLGFITDSAVADSRLPTALSFSPPACMRFSLPASLRSLSSFPSASG